MNILSFVSAIFLAINGGLVRNLSNNISPERYQPTTQDVLIMHTINAAINNGACSDHEPLLQLIQKNRDPTTWVEAPKTTRKDYLIWYIYDSILASCDWPSLFEQRTTNINFFFRPTQLPQTGKPVIYLYPEVTQQVNVTLQTAWSVFFTYPAYNNGRDVIATPDGTVYDGEDEYSYLFRDGYDTHDYYDLEKGFVLHRDNFVDFLKESLQDLWLTPIEYNEFIVYRAPKMLAYDSPYILVHVASESEYAHRNPLTITPTPDVLERVYLVFKPLETFQEVTPQELAWFDREWFTVVERWGTDLGELEGY